MIIQFVEMQLAVRAVRLVMSAGKLKGKSEFPRPFGIDLARDFLLVRISATPGRIQTLVLAGVILL